MDLKHHKVGKQTIELILEDGKEAGAFQDRIGDLYRAVLLPGMDEIFTRFSGEETLRIGRLEIDIGTVSPESLEEEFTEKVLRALRDEMAGIRARSAEGVAGPDFPAGEEMKAAWSGGNREDSRTVSAKTADLELLVHYLRTGTLPWWASVESPAGMEEKFLSLLEDRTTAETVRHELEKRYVRRRIIHQFSAGLVLKLLEAIGTENPDRIRERADGLVELHEKHPFTPLTTAVFRLILWDTVLEDAAAGGTGILDTDRLLKALSGDTGTPLDAVAGAMVRAFREWSPAGTGPGGALSAVVSALAKYLPPRAGTGGSHGPPPPEGRRERPKAIPGESRPLVIPEGESPGEGKGGPGLRAPYEGVRRSTSVPGPVETRRSVPPRRDRGSGREVAGEREVETTVWNAGLVLLWPYLGSFFENLGLTEEGVFRDEGAAHRGVHLLEYLATGGEGSPEYLLPLNKLLCGRDTSEPVSRDFAMTEREREEAESLLSSVISHWSVLKNTSIEGLRRSFLQREGILGEREKGWELKVERKPYDVLLDHLPWSISVIRLSWMKTVIYVTW